MSPQPRIPRYYPVTFKDVLPTAAACSRLNRKAIEMLQRIEGEIPYEQIVIAAERRGLRVGLVIGVIAGLAVGLVVGIAIMEEFVR